MPRDDVILSPRTSAWTVRASLEHTLAALAPTDPAGSVLVAPVAEGPDGEAAARTALGRLGADADGLLATHEPAGTAGTTTTVPLPPGAHAVRRVLLVGTGDGSAASWRKAGAAVGRATRGKGEVVHAVGDTASGDALAAYVETVVLASWASPRWTRDGAVAGCEPAEAAVVTGTSDARPVERAVLRARAQLVARGLAATPSNTKNPAWLARQARTLAGRTGLAAAGLGRAPAAGRRLRRHPRGRPGVGHAAPVRAARPRAARRDRVDTHGWCSSARASRSTPVACRSSRSTACSG